MLSEVWTNDLSEYYLEENIFYNFPRLGKHELAFRSSGGIAMFLHRDLKKGVDVGFKSREGIVWSKFRKDFFNLEYDLYLCCIYLPPEKSKHEIDFCFSLIEADVASFPENSLILVAGDANARCGQLKDYINDHFSFTTLEFQAPLVNCLDNIVISDLSSKNELKRSSRDNTINNFGKKPCRFMQSVFVINF